MLKKVNPEIPAEENAPAAKTNVQPIKKRASSLATTILVLTVFAVAISFLIYNVVRFSEAWAHDSNSNLSTTQTVKAAVNEQNSDEGDELDFTYLRPDRPETNIYLNGKNKDAGVRFFIFPVQGRITGGYGIRNNPFDEFGFTEFHAGLDVGAPLGTPVRAAAKGSIKVAGWENGYGNVVIIEHDKTKVTTRYGHLSRIDVAPGQTVVGGQQIGLVGSTGRSTGPHLHYEVRIDGQTVNPLSAYPKR